MDSVTGNSTEGPRDVFSFTLKEARAEIAKLRDEICTSVGCDNPGVNPTRHSHYEQCPYYNVAGAQA